MRTNREAPQSMSLATPDIDVPQPVYDTPVRPKRLHVTVIRGEGAGWIAFMTGTNYVFGRFVSSSEATRWIRKQRWKYPTDVEVCDDNGEPVGRFTTGPKEARFK